MRNALLLIAAMIGACTAQEPAMAAPGAIVIFVMTAKKPVLPASSGDCYTIQDADRRAYCLAREHRDASRCYAIQSAALRSECRAEVKE